MPGDRRGRFRPARDSGNQVTGPHRPRKASRLTLVRPVRHARTLPSQARSGRDGWRLRRHRPDGWGGTGVSGGA